MSSAVQTARLSPSSRCQILRQKATFRRSSAAASGGIVTSASSCRTMAPRTEASASLTPERSVPIPCAIWGRPPPFAPMGAAAALTSSPAEIPRSTRSSETVTKICGASASSSRAITPDSSAARTAFAAALSASVDSYGMAAATNRTPGATSSALAASSVGCGTPEAAPAFRRRFVSRSSSCSAAMRSSTASIVCAPTAPATRSSASLRSRASRSAAAPVTASIRRIPEPMLRSPVMLKPPIWPVARQWVPPHSSKL